MNTVLENAQSSQGVRVELSWEPAPHLDPAERSAFALAKKSVGRRTPEENDRLQRILMDRIRATRAQGRSSGYAEVLAAALDYRQWYTYRVRVHDTGPDGRPRDRRIRQLSSGETRLVSYVTLFAASAAFYDALQSEIDGPLRMVLLDEAFERLDDPTIARLLELLVDLDMDWAITWPSGYGVSPKIDRMHIYDVLKRKARGASPAPGPRGPAAGSRRRYDVVRAESRIGDPPRCFAVRRPGMSTGDMGSGGVFPKQAVARPTPARPLGC
ncbi:SbcC/MukB-like Walker B domain-containing protein [Allosalinactinospora lopnorensis]|uniref:SbcC/MukB-like Walker B domain-containing protein n=1 Tax=Allosalinactinospora lopnorensis TaxID=1352348 RepID=UPI0030846B1C